ncbi:hypothetical protein SEA_TEATEALATTE_92 [Gordonia phage Teatealatte]|uniref:Uncharacterized protein n=2 Tax=Demosthenesvirus katyusha TaxID=1982108 RepID=A0A345MCC7_9CAUD|nr:hypothetical protein SEA_TEATEALATTE_92 [Gordonia phage Teatealatte]QBP29647.1 hypothetical protein SEA_TREDGE_91 [Gordonia phage Tredge]
MNPWLYGLQVAVVLVILISLVAITVAGVCEMLDWEDE